MPSLNENLIIDPHYKTMRVYLAANNSVERPRGSLICKKATDDGTLDIYGTTGYSEPFGVLLDDVSKDTSVHEALVLVQGECAVGKVLKNSSGTVQALEMEAYATDPDGKDNLIIRRARDFGILIKQ